MKQEYLNKMEMRLKELDAEIRKLKAMAETSRMELRERYLEQVGRLRSARERARSELAKLRDAGSDRYDAVRKDLESAYDDLKKGIDEIIERIRKAA
jgi:hypothetical protein